MKELFKDGNFKSMSIGGIIGTVVGGSIVAGIGLLLNKKHVKEVDEIGEIVDYTIEEAPSDETTSE